MRPLIDTKQVAELLGCSETKVRIMSSEGRIPRLKIGGSVRYDPDKLEEWLAKNAEDPKLSPSEKKPKPGLQMSRRNAKRAVNFTLD
ncbi:MAG TPA: helix-turn-helix domain-containing protein [bacterium]